MLDDNLLKPWTLKYKPFNINEIQIDSNFRNKFARMLTQKNVPNLIIYGPSGSGKTSIGKYSKIYILSI
jgi:replication-associated recombination protein RarA